MEDTKAGRVDAIGVHFSPLIQVITPHLYQNTKEICDVFFVHKVRYKGAMLDGIGPHDTRQAVTHLTILQLRVSIFESSYFSYTVAVHLNCS